MRAGSGAVQPPTLAFGAVVTLLVLWLVTMMATWLFLWNFLFGTATRTIATFVVIAIAIIWWDSLV